MPIRNALEREFWTQAAHLKHVVPIDVPHVPAPDLGGHVPAVEGGRGEHQPPTVEEHPGHRREGVPLQAEVLEPVVPLGNRKKDKMPC